MAALGHKISCDGYSLTGDRCGIGIRLKPGVSKRGKHYCHHHRYQAQNVYRLRCGDPECFNVATIRGLQTFLNAVVLQRANGNMCETCFIHHTEASKLKDEVDFLKQFYGTTVQHEMDDLEAFINEGGGKPIGAKEAMFAEIREKLL